MNHERFARAFSGEGFRRTVNALRHVGAGSDAEEIAQLAWARAWEHRGQLRDRTRLLAWVIATGINEFRDTLRRRRFTTHCADGLEPQIAPSVNLAGIDLRRALERLPAHQSVLLQVVYLEETGLDQVATDLGISRDALHHRISRAKGALRKAMNAA